MHTDTLLVLQGEINECYEEALVSATASRSEQHSRHFLNGVQLHGGSATPTPAHGSMCLRSFDIQHPLLECLVEPQTILEPTMKTDTIP